MLDGLDGLWLDGQAPRSGVSWPRGTDAIRACCRACPPGRNMSLLDGIRADFVNDKVSLANKLRKAKSVPEFSDWVKFELG